jgi:hypothetical protein
MLVRKPKRKEENPAIAAVAVMRERWRSAKESVYASRRTVVPD